MGASTSDDGHWRLRGLGAIAHPAAMVALVTLIAHDAVLRPLLPAVVGGKLSDVAGLVVFPLVLAALAAVVVPDDDAVILLGCGVTVIWFTAMKLVPAVAAATVRLSEVVTPAAAITLDVTDLLTLPAVGVAVWIWRHPVPPRAWGAPILVLAVVWSAATSCDQPPSGRAVSVQPDGSFVVGLDGQTVHVSPDGGVGEPSYEADLDRFRSDPSVANVCLDDGTCIRADGHDVVEITPDGAAETAVDIPEGRFVFAQRTRGGCGPQDYEPVQDMASNDEGVVVVAHGSHGVSVRTADGQWSRPDVGATLFAGPLPVDFVTAAIALALLGLILATWTAGAEGIFGLLAATAAAGAAAFSFSGAMGLLLAWPGIGFAIGFGFVQLAITGQRLGARHVLAVAGAHVVGGWVAWVVVWTWAAGWIDSARLTGALMGLSVASVTGVCIVRAQRSGMWPAPRPAPQPAPQPAPPSGEAADGRDTEPDA